MAPDVARYFLEGGPWMFAVFGGALLGALSVAAGAVWLGRGRATFATLVIPPAALLLIGCAAQATAQAELAEVVSSAPLDARLSLFVAAAAYSQTAASFAGLCAALLGLGGVTVVVVARSLLSSSTRAGWWVGGVGVTLAALCAGLASVTTVIGGADMTAPTLHVLAQFGLLVAGCATLGLLGTRDADERRPRAVALAATLAGAVCLYLAASSCGQFFVMRATSEMWAALSRAPEEQRSALYLALLGPISHQQVFAAVFVTAAAIVGAVAVVLRLRTERVWMVHPLASIAALVVVGAAFSVPSWLDGRLDQLWTNAVAGVHPPAPANLELALSTSTTALTEGPVVYLTAEDKVVFQSSAETSVVGVRGALEAATGVGVPSAAQNHGDKPRAVSVRWSAGRRRGPPLHIAADRRASVRALEALVLAAGEPPFTERFGSTWLRVHQVGDENVAAEAAQRQEELQLLGARFLAPRVPRLIELGDARHAHLSADHAVLRIGTDGCRLHRSLVSPGPEPKVEATGRTQPCDQLATAARELEALDRRLAEVHVAAAPDAKVERLVQALDAIRATKEGRDLFDRAVFAAPGYVPPIDGQ